eukprot:jgi/Phyca11/508293/fgenesh2_kg.PHYCAscaffold_33_\
MLQKLYFDAYRFEQKEYEKQGECQVLPVSHWVFERERYQDEMLLTRDDTKEWGLEKN